MKRQLSFIISDDETIDGVLTAYAREWLLIAASELQNETRTLVSMTKAVGTNRHRVARWLDALRIRQQVEDVNLLVGSDYPTSKSTRKVRFNVIEGDDDLDGALTAYAREWLLLEASELPSTEYTLDRLASKIGTNRQRLARWLDALQIRDEVDQMRNRLLQTG